MMHDIPNSIVCITGSQIILQITELLEKGEKKKKRLNEQIFNSFKKYTAGAGMPASLSFSNRKFFTYFAPPSAIIS